MRFVCISDTHGFHDRIELPDGDVLIHAGDMTNHGSPSQLFDVFAWLSKQPHERIIVVPGNHDFGLERLPDVLAVLQGKFSRVKVLLDSETMIDGLRVYGSPWQPWHNDWAFNFLPGPAGIAQAEEKWSDIPDDTAILITHGPSRGVLDETLKRKHVGCEAMKARMESLPQLRLHVFGHVHEAHGIERIGEVLHVNACICDSRYFPEQQPWVLDYVDGVFVEVMNL